MEQMRTYIAEATLIATGAQARWLDLPSEMTCKGFGVPSCATCDRFLYPKQGRCRGRQHSRQEALHLPNLASKLTVVHPSTSLPSRVDPAGQPLGSKLRLETSGTE